MSEDRNDLDRVLDDLPEEHTEIERPVVRIAAMLRAVQECLGRVEDELRTLRSEVQAPTLQVVRHEALRAIKLQVELKRVQDQLDQRAKWH